MLLNIPLLTYFGFLIFASAIPWSQSIRLTAQETALLMQSDECQVLLTESIPENVTYPDCSPSHWSTYSAWQALLRASKHNVSIASFYWSLLDNFGLNVSSAFKGSDIFSELEAKSKSLKLLIAQSGPKHDDSELGRLTDSGAVVYWLDVAKLLGQGILHTKLWTIDALHAYLGSANMDWRSLTQVKELGVTLLNCPRLVSDLDKIQASYRLVSEALPPEWPAALHTEYNATNPLKLSINGIQSRVYFASSPPQFNAPGRSNDLDTILSIINGAENFIFISVMSYSPQIINYANLSASSFWPDIDNALRRAVLERNVEVRLLFSKWSHTTSSMYKFLSSLKAISGIKSSNLRVRLFEIPAVTEEQKKIPYARVNHNKYMVTDKTCYIGTSNWSGDYFLFTGGVSFVYEEDEESTQIANEVRSIRAQTEQIFRRDWNSEYALEL